jgi:hypothetical protein
MARVMVTLRRDEREALRVLAQQERRDPRDQAALLIRGGLEQRGLLLSTDQRSKTQTREDR